MEPLSHGITNNSCMEPSDHLVPFVLDYKKEGTIHNFLTKKDKEGENKHPERA